MPKITDTKQSGLEPQKASLGVTGRIARLVSEWRYTFRIPFFYSIILATVVGVIVGIQNYTSARKLSQLQKEEILQFRDVIEQHMNAFDFKGATSLSVLLEGRKFVRRLTVTDENNFVVYKTTDYAPYSGKPVIYDFPLKHDRDKNAGTAHLQIEVYDQAVHDWRWPALAQSLLVFCGTLLVSLHLMILHIARNVVQPLNSLSNAVSDTLRTGNPMKTSALAPTHIGKFAANFNLMQERLDQVQTSLRENVSALNQQTSINLQQMGILESVLSNTGVLVRHYGRDGSYQDYGQIRSSSTDHNLPVRFIANTQAMQKFLSSIHSETNIVVLPHSKQPGTMDQQLLYQIEFGTRDSRWLILTAYRLSGGSHALAMFDVTAAREEYRRSSHTSKMEALGTLSSGVAHDFNNVLAIVTGILELVLMDDDLEPRVRNNLEKAQETAWRGAKVVKAMLESVRDRGLKADHVKLGTLLENIKPILHSAIPSEIKLDIDIRHDAVSLLHSHSFETALFNLITNARDAIEGKGWIRISLNIARNNELLELGLKENAYACIEVTDNGRGVPQEFVERIFDPFFSTKSLGEGTGLGLTQVYNFARETSGSLVYKRMSPTGSSFTLYLPITDSKSVSAKPKRRDPALKKPSLNLLLIDDENEIRRTYTAYLTQAHHQVRSAQSIEQAYRILPAKGPVSFDVIVSDYHLKDGTGKDVLRYVKGRAPILFMSGNNISEIVEAFQNVDFMLKPFSLVEMEQRVVELSMSVAADIADHVSEAAIE